MNTELIVMLVSGSLLMLLLVGFIVVFAFLFKRKQYVYLREKAAMKAQYEQEILTSQIEVQNTTLQQISQELHDNIGQLLSVVRINLNIVEETPPGADSRDYIRQANELVGRSISELRALSKSLDGDFVEDFGLTESIELELQRIRNTRLCQTDFHLHGRAGTLGFQREIVLYRIFQELLNNALKHAGATHLTVDMHYQPESVQLMVSDNGRGFDYAQIRQQGKQGAGLRNMQRRASLIGGTCAIDSLPGRGTTTTITLVTHQP